MRTAKTDQTGGDAHGSSHCFMSCGGPNGFENRKYGCIIKRLFYSVW